MRTLGRILLALGVLVGVIVALAIATGFQFAGVPWLLNVGLAKLGLLSSGGLMAAGAVAQRLANRAESRRLAGDSMDMLGTPRDNE